MRMQPIKRILVAVKNPRQKSFPALNKAAALARALDAELELFHAISGPIAFDAFSDEAMRKYEHTERQRNLKRLESTAEALRRKGLVVKTAVEWDYPSHEAVIRHARRSRSDLIVVGQHATAHVARWLLRYTDWELLRQSPVPVLLVKKPRPYRTPKVLAAVDPSHSFAKTAQLDRVILDVGKAVSGAARGAMHVVHAYVPTIDDISEGQLRQPDATQLIIGHAALQATKRLDKTLHSAGLDDLKRSRRHLIARHPTDAIPALAKKLGCDIVVMGALSRSGLKRFFIGNTAERLFDDLPCDLLIVKPPGFKSQVPNGIRGPELYFPTPPTGMI
jgi:universal stress protein E